VGRGGPRVEAGARFAGHVSSLGTRLVPDLAGGDPLVRDLARNIVTDFAVADVWTGSAELELFDSEFEELAALRPVRVTGGFRCSLAFSVTGAEIRH
jgi:acetoacetate decarboxylase